MSLKGKLKNLRITIRKVRYERIIYNFANSFNDINIKNVILDSMLEFKDSNKVTQRFIRKNLYKIKEWLSSNEFKEKYADSPFYPLLNPDEINYKYITDDVAYSLNLPLPNYYNFYFLAASFSAHDACLDMLRFCGVQSVPHHNANFRLFFNEQYNLINYKNVDSMHKLAFFILYAGSHYKENINDIHKFLHLTYKSDKKILYIVRDPLERLKSALNNSYVDWHKTIEPLSIESKPKDILKNRTLYWINREDSNFMDNISKFNFDLFAMDSITAFLNRDKIYYLDFKKTFPKYAFETFSELSKIFGFNPPNINHFPTTKKWGMLARILPAIINVDSKFIESNTANNGGGGRTTLQPSSIKIFANPYNYTNTSKINITQEFIDSKYLKEDLESLSLFVESKVEFDFIMQNMQLKQKLQEYFSDFCRALKEEIVVVQSKFVGKNDILEYLKTHKETRINLRNLLDKELSHIKESRPDIIESWVDYNEFINMCDELDSIN